MLGRSSSRFAALAKLGRAALANPTVASHIFTASTPATVSAMKAFAASSVCTTVSAAAFASLARPPASTATRAPLRVSLPASSARFHQRPLAARSAASASVSALLAPVTVVPARASSYGRGLDSNHKKLTEIEVAELENDPHADALTVYELPDAAVKKLRQHMLAAALTAGMYPAVITVLNNYVAYPYSIGVTFIGALLCLRQLSNVFALNMAIRKMVCVWPSDDELATERAEDYEARAALNLRESEQQQMYLAEMETRKAAADAQAQALAEGRTADEAADIARTFVKEHEPTFEAESEEMSSMPSKLYIYRLGMPWSTKGTVLEIDPTKIKTRRLGPQSLEMKLLPEDIAASVEQDPRLKSLMFWADDTTPVLFNALHVTHVGAMNQLIQAANTNGVAEDLRISPLSRKWNYANQGHARGATPGSTPDVPGAKTPAGAEQTGAAPQA